MQICLNHLPGLIKIPVELSVSRWMIEIFQEVIDLYPPARPVTAKRLAEMIVSVIEGGLILERAYGNRGMTARQSEQFREYLALLFPSASAGRAA